MKNFLTMVDPAYYGWNRSAVVFGLIAGTVAIVVCCKLLDVLRAAGLP